MLQAKTHVLALRRHVDGEGAVAGYVRAVGRDGGFVLTPHADKARAFAPSKAAALAGELYRPPGTTFEPTPILQTPRRPAAGT